ncbi:uncharacterized protein LOC117245021 isoform X1 [Parus major]|uniref:uncharacterized protein LOC117245021 isoform X1 n=1 Tax=Parus major TaxID=9157 RepID=UPI001443BA00|nr:uncharacterized protein LOC117245021 isoform X1 [Parus major]
MERLARGLIKPEMRLQLPACIAPTLPRLQLPACIAPTLPRLQLPACIALTPPRLQLPACIALTPPAGVGRRLAERRGIAGPRGERAAERCGQGRSRVPGGSGSAPAHRRDRQQGNAHICRRRCQGGTPEFQVSPFHPGRSRSAPPRVRPATLTALQTLPLLSWAENSMFFGELGQERESWSPLPREAKQDTRTKPLESHLPSPSQVSLGAGEGDNS